ncbi:MAG: UDP-3-O-(3-hydroxymyristoyl) glucosamine N-acyltransferase [Burkholderiaceae bacterium]|nr:UDP-3-O-(3-hydroxymyristoyl) glucosamine N-acyltransferase [Burkholderiaceae bacterium]
MGNIRLGELVERFGGQLAGEPDIKVSGIAPLDSADASQLTFLSNSRLRSQAEASRAAALILSPADDEIVAASYTGARIVTSNPYAYFARVAQWFEQQREIPAPVGVHPLACVDPAARIAPTASIGPYVTIEAGAEIAAGVVIGAGSFVGRGAKIGANTRLAPRVTFHAGCVIGENGIIHSGAVIGTEGFGFANDAGKWIKIPQTGRVVCGNDVQIGANTTIDRGTLDDTVIEDGVKLDNQIQVGHNCHIGAHSAAAGCVGIAGSATIGKHCMLGGAAMIGGHLTIADGVFVTAASSVMNSIKEPGQYTSIFPLTQHKEWERTAAMLRNIKSMRDRIRELEKKIKDQN